MIFFYFFAQNVHYERTSEAVLTSTHNVCFGSKIRKLGIPLQFPVFLYISLKRYILHGQVFLMISQQGDSKESHSEQKYHSVIFIYCSSHLLVL